MPRPSPVRSRCSWTWANRSRRWRSSSDGAGDGDGSRVEVRLQAALGLARAASGDGAAAHRALAAAEQRVRAGRVDAAGTDAGRVDTAHRRDGPPIELADVHRWHGRALVSLGEIGAVTPLRSALAAGPRSARHRAALHADLALALAGERPEESAEHARSAREIAEGIGSACVVARLAALGVRR